MRLSQTVRYAGSLLKCSFAEHDHEKSVSVVEIDAPGSAPGDAGAAGRVTVETVALTPRRDVRRLEGTPAELLAGGASDPRCDDYVLAALRDRGALLDPIGRLRGVYPNALGIERPLYETAGSAGARRPRPGSVGDLDLFDTFFEHATGARLDEPQRAALAAVIDGLERRRREAPG